VQLRCIQELRAESSLQFTRQTSWQLHIQYMYDLKRWSLVNNVVGSDKVNPLTTWGRVTVNIIVDSDWRRQWVLLHVTWRNSSI